MTDPATAAATLLKGRPSEAALRLCDLNIAALSRSAGEEALAGATQWRLIRAEVERLSQQTPP